MPKLGGLDLANRLAAERPNLRILMVSGYNRKEMLATDAPARMIGFLQKPFTPTELLDKVVQMLAIPQGPDGGDFRTASAKP
jgi:FixJ family two-component response regulator